MECRTLSVACAPTSSGRRARGHAKREADLPFERKGSGCGRGGLALPVQRLAEREAIGQLRMEALLEITQGATSSLELEQILKIALEKLSRVIVNDRCSVVLVEGANTRQAQVVASAENPSVSAMQLDLARYPELRRALETRQPVYIQDALRGPLMADVRSHITPLGVRSILGQPLICQEDLLVAVFLRLSRSE